MVPNVGNEEAPHHKAHDVTFGDKDTTKEASYWNSFYTNFAVQEASPFGTWVAEQLQAPSNKLPIVEFGCGNGRDSLYLAKQGYSVIASDLSTEAIHNNRLKAAALTSQQNTTCNNKIRISFDECNVVNSQQVSELIKKARATESSNIAIYHRFFLHSIDEEQQNAFLTALSQNSQSGDVMYMEYRAAGDALLSKVHGTSHYRRYIDTPALVEWMQTDLKFQCVSETTGQGMAVYKTEDPVVSRVVLKRK